MDTQADFNKHRVLRFCRPRFLFSFSFDFKVRQQYSAVRRISNSLLGIWISDETLSLVFDILHEKTPMCFLECVILLKQNGLAEWETASSQAKRLTPEEVAMGSGEERTPAANVALLKSRN